MELHVSISAVATHALNARGNGKECKLVLPIASTQRLENTAIERYD
jgi:hypothetical protein